MLVMLMYAVTMIPIKIASQTFIKILNSIFIEAKKIQIECTYHFVHTTHIENFGSIKHWEIW